MTPTLASRIAFGLALAMLALCSLSVHAAQSWPTTRFEAFVGEPFMGSNWQGDLVGVNNLDDEEEDDRPHPTAIADVERAFSEAAEWYRRKGFPAPNLGPIVDTENGAAYRIYLCKYREGGFACGHDPATGNTIAAAYIPLCNDDPTRTRIVYVNWEQAIGNTLGLNEIGYQSVAHELMHAIVDSTPFGTPSACGTIGGWITEGLADAISFDLADEVWVKQNRYQQGTSSPEIIKRYGYRPYLESLPQGGKVPIPLGGPDLTATYTSSSFWRYLADSYPGGWQVLLTKKKPKAAPGLLDIPIKGKPGWQREVKWLDKGLHGKFNRGLAEMYGLFVNHFPYRVAPMESYAGKPAEDNLEHWTGLLFNQCASVDLSDASKQVITLYLMGLGSRCISVEPTAAGLIQVSFNADSEDETLLQDISIGQAGTTIVQRSIVAPNPASTGSFVASWRDFPQDGSKRSLYVVSNAARKPADSQRRTLTLTVTKAGYSNSAWAGPLPPAPVAPKPQKPSYDKHAKSLERQKRDTARMINEQMNLDKQSLNPNVSSSTNIQRRPNIPECVEPFKYTACGPHFTISLALMPGTYIAPGMANAQGGIAAQTFGAMQAMAQTSLFDSEQTMKQLKARVEAIDGSAVNIAIPLIDYGFSGTIPNAAISVDMSGGKTLSAFGPPDEQHRTKLTGSVTITEFTPLVISGSFVAPLAEFEQSGDQEPVYVTRQTVTGTFSSVAPWQSDERVQILPESTEQMADDIANSMGVSAEMIHSMKQQGTFLPESASAGPGSASSSGGGGVVQTGECSCECEQRPFADDLCELFCEEEFAACESP